MSHTDKDRPYWVRMNDPLEPNRIEYHTCGRAGHECTIDVKLTGKRQPDWGLPCVYHESYMTRYGLNNVPKWFVDATWNNPERVRTRDKLRDMTKDYNTNYGDADLDIESPQHRHRSRWYWD